MNEENKDPALTGEDQGAVADLNQTPSAPATVRESLEAAKDQLSQQADPAAKPDAAGSTPSDQAAVGGLQPPQHWSAEDKAMFAKQSPDAQKWLMARHKAMEGDNTRNSQALSEYKKRFEQVEQIFAPHRDRLQASGQTEADVVRNLLAAQLFLEKDPITGLKWLAQNLKVDLKQLIDGAQPADGGEDDPFGTLHPKVAETLKSLTDKVGQFETAAQQAQREAAERGSRELQQTIQEFTTSKNDAGEPLYPHMENDEVRTTMSALIKSGRVDIAKCGGVAPALKTAYEMAVYAVPGTRDALLKAAKAAEEKKAADERARAVQKAKKAGVSVSGASTSAAPSTSKGSVRATLLDTAREAGWSV